MLTATVVCGAANNQLAHPGVEKDLADRGILYAPDYVVNAGGVIQVADELHGFDFDRAKAQGREDLRHHAGDLRAREDDGVPPAAAADRIAEQRMADARRAARGWLRPRACVTGPRRTPGETEALTRSASRPLEEG